MQEKELESIYRKNKSTGRYYPVGVCYEPHWLPDGIWLVTHTPGCSSHRNLDYRARMLKVGNPKLPDYTKLAGNVAVVDKVLEDERVRDIWSKGCSLYDIASAIVTVLNEKVTEVDDGIEDKNRFVCKENLMEDGFTTDGNYWSKEFPMTGFMVLTNLIDDRKWLATYKSIYTKRIVCQVEVSYMHEIYEHLKLL